MAGFPDMKKVPVQVWVFIGSLVFFLLTLAENFSGPHDSITYLNGIVDGYPLVNQHHLLYHYVAYCWMHFWHSLFPSVKNFYLIESFSAFCGSCSLMVIFSFFYHRFRFSVIASLASCLPVAFSYGFWFYSINIEVYAPPIFFILYALYFLSKNELSRNDWYKVIALHILAILFHQINILFAVVILYRLWTDRKKLNLTRWLAFYAGAGVLLVGGAYFIVGWIVEKQNTLSSWIAWLKGYAGGDTYWHKLDSSTPIDIGYGFSHAFLGGHYIFQLPPVKQMLKTSLSNHSLSDELFLARSIPESMAVFLTILTILLALLSAYLLFYFLRNYSVIQKKTGRIIKPVILTFFVYSIFFVFWMPEILEFWILQTALLWLVLIGTMNLGEKWKSLKPFPTALSIGFLLFCINYFGSIRWMQHKEYDLYYVKTQRLQELATDKDVIVLQEGWIVKDFLHYYTRLQVLSVPEKDSSWVPVNEAINRSLQNNGSIFILPEINNRLHAPDTRYLDSLRAVYSNRLILVRPADPQVWKIQ